MYYINGRENVPHASGAPAYVVFSWDENGNLTKEIPCTRDGVSSTATEILIHQGDYGGRYENGNMEKVIDVSIEQCYFAEKGIYYQIGTEIFLVDYSGNNSKFIVQIPEELYRETISNPSDSRLIVYRDSIWYHCGNMLNGYDIPLWEYNLKTKESRMFDVGAVIKANNGYLYFAKEDTSDYGQVLWRFNIETYSIEQVSDFNFTSIDFCKQNILLLSSNNELYKINSSGTTKIFNTEQFGENTWILSVSVHESRIFVTVKDNTELSSNVKIFEIDINGDIISTIV